MLNMLCSMFYYFVLSADIGNSFTPHSFMHSFIQQILFAMYLLQMMMMMNDENDENDDDNEDDD